MPTSVSLPARIPPPPPVRAVDPREKYISERLKQRRFPHDPHRREEEEDEEPSRPPGSGLVTGGIVLLSVGGLSLLLGGALRQQYNADPPEPRAPCTSFCFPLLSAIADYKPKGTVLLFAGMMEVLAGATLLTFGLLRQRATRLSMQRTLHGTWTIGVTHRF